MEKSEMTREETLNFLCKMCICPSKINSILKDEENDNDKKDKKVLMYLGHTLEEKAIEFLKHYNEWGDEEEKLLKKNDYYGIIRNANYVRKLQLVDIRCKTIKDNDELIEFEGKNCDECNGWDGVSRRCQCGNRRVDWEYDYNELFLLDDEEGVYYIYGEAY